MTEAPGANPALEALIRAEIERDGPITFARFMELALYHPLHGYYRTERAAVGRAGADFLTAPETHPIFGRVLGRQVAEFRERLGGPAPFTVREYAAGAGALAAAILEELGPPVRYQAIELNAHRRGELVARLPGVAAFESAPAEPIVGVVIANELLDALPVHRVVMRQGRLREVHVALSGGSFADEERDPSTPALAARLAGEGIELREGQRADISLAVAPWVDELARTLTRGYVIVVDYGDEARVLFSPRRRAGTLLGYAGHRVVDDPYANVGRQDLTAHVDFTAVERAASVAGFDLLGRTSQAEFLLGAGAEELLEQARNDPGTDVAAWTALRSGLARLLDPRHTGRFQVLILGRGVPRDPPLRGLSFSMPSGRRA